MVQQHNPKAGRGTSSGKINTSSASWKQELNATAPSDGCSEVYNAHRTIGMQYSQESVFRGIIVSKVCKESRSRF